MMTTRDLGALLLLFVGTLVVHAEQVQWRAARSSSPPPASARVQLLRPEPLPASRFSSVSENPRPIFRGQAPAPVPAVPPPPAFGAGPAPVAAHGAEDPYNCAVVPGGQTPGGFFSSIFGNFTGADSCRKPFESDHEFDYMISPVTNPFYFEDPRALTEVRPIFMWQDTPAATPTYNGGDILFLGGQARLALTDRWSIVVHKLGAISQDPKNPIPGQLDTGTGFAELWLGPKYTFIRNDSSRTLLAAGAIFELPIGSAPQAQNTGDLSITPYLSFAQNFGRTSYGSFNFMSTVGYSLAVDSQRSDHLYTSLHLDYDVLELHKFYPLIEFNWFNYTRNGGARPIDFEGADLYNFGATNVKGNNFMSLAFGARYKFSEAIQIGGAVEFPVTGRHDLMNLRVTLDMIFRY